VIPSESYHLIATDDDLRTLLKVTHPNWSQSPLDGLTPIVERRPEPFTTSLMCPRCTETECLPHRMYTYLIFKPISSHFSSRMVWPPSNPHRFPPNRNRAPLRILRGRLYTATPASESVGICIFWPHSLGHFQIPFEWPDALVDELQDLVIHGFVTANPCDLGVVMKQPCWQVCIPLIYF
jgi:hypothetical protein